MKSAGKLQKKHLSALSTPPRAISSFEIMSLSSDSKLPPSIDFMIIGAPRCATTWLSNCLSEHPLVHMPEEELNFWTPGSGLSMSWYARQFKSAGQESHIGENSSLYLNSSEAAQEVSSRFREIKAIVILRDPFERALSHFRMRKANGIYHPDLTFREACGASDVRGAGLMELSQYASGLEEWLRRVGAERLNILFYEDIDESPLKTFQSVLAFLGINPDFVPEATGEKPGTARRTMPRGSARIIRAGVRCGRLALGPVWPYCRRGARRLGMRKIVRALSVREDVSAQDIPDRETEEWFRQMVQADVTRLEQLLGCNLSHWKPECASSHMGTD